MVGYGGSGAIGSGVWVVGGAGPGSLSLGSPSTVAQGRGLRVHSLDSHRPAQSPPTTKKGPKIEWVMAFYHGGTD